MPDKHPILIFNDIKFEQLKSLVAFIYNGSVNVSENNIHDFLNAAQSLLIKGLSEETKDENRNGEHGKKVFKNIEINDSHANFRKISAIPPIIRKPEIYFDSGKNMKKQRQPLLKHEGGHFVECEESLSKLQEISFTKYIHQNLNSKPLVRTDNNIEHNWNGPSDEKLRPSDNYVVKSWKHNSVEDLNGKHKQNKNNALKKIKLTKPVTSKTEESEQKTINESPDRPTGTDLVKADDVENKIKKEIETENEEIMLVEPKPEMIEEEDTNLEEYDHLQPSNNEAMISDSDSMYDSRSAPAFYQPPVVDRGVPVPLLMCRTSLNELDSVEPNWMPQISGSLPTDHSPHVHPPDNNSQDMQCRTCAQDLPCPTCTKKYKSRYALNRHILYECGKARKSFSCDECGKKVTRQDTLQKHKLIHLVEHLKKKENEGKRKKRPTTET